MKRTDSSANIILYLATYPPRECGIATFTQDLAKAFDQKFNPATKSRVVALNESPANLYNYDGRALAQIASNRLEDYAAMAEKINRREEIKIVNIQHEFGIFGGQWGDYLIPFLQVVKKPVVTTLHSVVALPDDFLKNLTRFICGQSRAVIVMNDLSRDLLVSVYEVAQSKIVVIPHGIPSTTLEPSAVEKAKLGLKDKIVLSTFGLLSPNKGVEYAIRALPPLVKKYPNLLYLVIGETHPLVRRAKGEKYRNFLMQEVIRLNLQNHVKFYDKYLALDEIVAHLKATDIYVSPTLGLEQSVSGTLSYALGCGRPVVSTATSYAKYLVNEKLGMLVKTRSYRAITAALGKLLADDKLVVEMGREAYAQTRKMIWPNVAQAYFKVYARLADIRPEEDKLPDIKFDHLLRLTDGFGIIQHARYSRPEKRFGYTTDDNARALVASAKAYRRDARPELLSLMRVYLNFLKFAQRPSGYFSNLVSYRRERDRSTEEDAQGRAVWALGYILSCPVLPDDVKDLAGTIFRKSLRVAAELHSPRAIAFALAGLYHNLKVCPEKRLIDLFEKLTARQMKFYKTAALPNWPWFEDQLTYSNSKLPESLFYAYDFLGRKDYLRVAKKTLEFLSRVTFERKHYSPIGQAGWFFRDKTRSYFDQQPEDTAAMVETMVAAFQATKNRRYLNYALRAFQWFLGRNHLNQMVYDEVTGGCHDGVGQNTLNLNQGAESTIAYLLARLALEEPEVKEALKEL